MFKEHPMELFERFKNTENYKNDFTEEESDKLFFYICSLINNGEKIDDHGAYYQLGRYFHFEKSNNLAKKWLHKAVSLGHIYAMNELGSIYKKEKNYDIARELYTNSADLGNVDAMNSLGCLFEYISTDIAIEWYTKAIELGNTKAMCNLGLLYEETYSTNNYRKEAKKLYLKAEALGSSRATELLKNLKEKYPELFKRSLEQIYDNEACCICFENYIGSSNYKIILNCGHTLHYECIKKEKKCPTCREPVNF